MDKRMGRGFSLIGFLFNLVVFVFVLLVIFRLGPIYMEHYKILKVFDGVKNELNSKMDLSNDGRTALRKAIERRFTVEDIRVVTPNSIVITPQGNAMQVKLAYESRVEFIANIDVVVKFDDTVLIQSNAAA